MFVLAAAAVEAVLAVVEVEVFTLILTAIGRVGRRAIEETWRRCHSEVRHAGVSVAVHAVADGIPIVTLLRGGARCISTW